MTKKQAIKLWNKEFKKTNHPIYQDNYFDSIPTYKISLNIDNNRLFKKNEKIIESINLYLNTTTEELSIKFNCYYEFIKFELEKKEFNDILSKIINHNESIENKKQKLIIEQGCLMLDYLQKRQLLIEKA